MDGVLLIDKPDGWTSHDVVAKVRNILKAEAGHKIKVGHTGTLDPAATGLLILVIGSYTKRAGEFSKLHKVYEAEITIGQTSSTGDKEGEITHESDKRPAPEKIDAVLEKFTGEVMQTPHKYSAIKVGGRKAYDAARKGRDLKLEPRPVTIHEITSIDYEYPRLRLTTKVSSGTYIRSLAEDIGQALGTGAYLSALHRTEVGKYKIEDAKLLPNISFSDIIKV